MTLNSTVSIKAVFQQPFKSEHPATYSIVGIENALLCCSKRTLAGQRLVTVFILV
jgi:hypothetical protein